MSPLSRVLLVGLLFTTMGVVRPARAEQEVPKELQGIAIDGTLGAKVPLDLSFVDQSGKQVQLRDYFVGGRPVILALAYYSCPMLCTLVLNGLVEGMRPLPFSPGKEYQVVTLSIDPRDQPHLALAKRAVYLQSLKRELGDVGRDWPFLSGSEQDIAKVAAAVGFHFRWDEEGKQWAHAAGIFVLTPDGRLSQILYGITFPERDLRLALVEASLGGIGSPLDKLLLWCFHYDPKERRYSLAAIALVRVGGVLTMMVLGSFLIAAWRRDRRARVNG
ncbi:MAG: SCO family protein [Myxococcales bacterium]|jgi:protein SCO1/2|nr:SCO family protein [Myxococcales bacterium]